MGFWSSLGNAALCVAKGVFEILANEKNKYDSARDYYDRDAVDEWSKEQFSREYNKWKHDPYKRQAIIRKAEEKFGDKTE